MSAEDEASLSEITILPDGRIYLFGASRQILEMLSTISRDDATLGSRLESLRAAEGQPDNNVGSAERQSPCFQCTPHAPREESRHAERDEYNTAPGDHQP